ncbi:uncharacterized protein [Rutidosis leptorrhynchoides]|uniref:uncharacterized protein n=1 Tax=Rutidosis leptorrhynchoides TaxID=125765 RepID=UPI003A9946E7
MATLQEPHLDLESGGDGGLHTHRQSTATTCGDGSSRSSDTSEISTIATTEIVGIDDVDKRRESTVSDFSVVDLESGGGIHGGDGDEGSKLHLSKIERDCRICHLSLDFTNNQDFENGNGIPIELGCSCKDDLAAAHKHCAEAWFKIKGNKTCEICGSIAQNVAGANDAELMEQWNEANDAMSAATAHGGTTTTTADARNFWQGHRFLNFLLACMVFAFVISWLFHFNVPS